MGAASKVEKGLCKDKGEDDEINFVLQLVMSSLSVIGSSSIIVSYYLMPKNQKAKILRCLLVWLSAMDLGASSAYLLLLLLPLSSPLKILLHAQSSYSTHGWVAGSEVTTRGLGQSLQSRHEIVYAR